MNKLAQAPLRVDMAGGWLDCPALAIPGAFIVNCAISPLVSLDAWPYERCSGLGGSAAFALLSGRDALKEELLRAGWQDPAIVMETGLCVWRSGKVPVLEMKRNPDWLNGLMALEWMGQSHDTATIKGKPRNYRTIAKAGAIAAQAVQEQDIDMLAAAIRLSYKSQRGEGMKPINPMYASCVASKYCGSGWGGYALHLFDSLKHRTDFVLDNVNARPIEPYMRSVESSVLLWA